MPCFYCSKGVFPLIQHRGSSYRYYWFILAVVGQRDWSTSWGEVPRAIQFNFRGAEGTNPDCHFTIGEDTTIESGWEHKHKLHHRIITSSFELISLTLSPWVINLKVFSDFFFKSVSSWFWYSLCMMSKEGSHPRNNRSNFATSYRNSNGIWILVPRQPNQ